MYLLNKEISKKSPSKDVIESLSSSLYTCDYNLKSIIDRVGESMSRGSHIDEPEEDFFY